MAMSSVPCRFTEDSALDHTLPTPYSLTCRKPWLAIPHAAHMIKPNGRIVSYSPCIEQSQKTIEAMLKCGFHSIKTVEVLLKEHYVDKVEIDLVVHVGNDQAESTTLGGNGGKRRKVLVARPFATMRGHTAFLTFVMAGNRKQPDPNMATELEDEKN